MMKKIHLKTFIGALLVAFLFVSCSDILDEKPRHIYDPGFFKTEKGVMGGIDLAICSFTLDLRSGLLL